MKRLLLALLLLATPAQASPVIADISTYRIAIDAGFTGIRLFIFGARNEPGDVIVVIRGPEKDYTVRKKERIGGVWVNASQMKFRSLPDFYAIASSRPLTEIRADNLLKLLGIGTPQLLVPPAKLSDEALFPEFSQAFFSHMENKRLYNEMSSLSFMGETLFKTVIPFPDTISQGNYTAEIYLVSDGELIGMQTMPIKVDKSGIDAWVANLAHQQPVLYGILAILLAIAAGWGAGRLFEKVG